MNRKYRKPFIAGNWKMNMKPSQVKAYMDELKTLVPRAKWCEVAICAPFTDLPALVKAVREPHFAVGAQNMSKFHSGAYTGEVSGEMLTDLGVKYVVIGHSERRQYFGETDELVNEKVLAALSMGLHPIVCIGESLEQREKGLTNELVTYQLKAAISGVPADKLRRITVAYEPIWAIGTGRTATAEQAGEVCSLIRAVIRSMYGARIARGVVIQYGGSMNDANAAELLAQPDIDGGLIGGASLKPEKFAAIINAANQE